MDTLAELVYEKADIDTRLALHQAYRVYKSIYWVQNFKNPRDLLAQKLPAILAKPVHYPDTTMVLIHKGYILVRHLHHMFLYEEMLGPQFSHPERWRDHHPRHLVRYSHKPYPLRHWSFAWDHVLHDGKDISIDTFFQDYFPQDPRFLPLIEQRLRGELEYQYAHYGRCVTRPNGTLGLDGGDPEGYVMRIQKHIRHLEAVQCKLIDYQHMVR